MAQQVTPDVYYPESDGQPMGETEIHRQLLTDLVFALERLFAGRPDAHVSGNVFIYYVQGNPRLSVCPDVFVAFGSHKRLVNTYQTWQDGPFPQVVIELTSASTRAEDQGPKRALYERLGVLEYYLFDPHFDPYIAGEPEPADEPERAGDLQRYVRASADVQFGPRELLAPGAAFHSEQLGLGLVVRGKALRLVDEASGRLVPVPAEETEARAEAEARAAEETAARAAEAAARMEAEARAQALADELARLRAELERRGGA